MKPLLLLSAAASLAALAACTTQQTPASPNMAEKQALVGARAGDKLPEGAETYVDGERVGAGAPGAETLEDDDNDADEAARPPGR